MRLRAEPASRLGPVVWKLMRLQLRISISGFRHARPRQKLGTIVLVGVVLALLVGAFLASAALLRFLRSPELAADIPVAGLIAVVPSLVLTSAFLAILLTGFGVLLQGLYLARDMEFLLSAPVPIRAVFISKMLQAILPNFGLTALFGLPVLFGLGASQGYRLLFYPLVVLVLVALALAAGGLSSLVVMGVVHVVPARRVAEVLAFVGAVLSLLCSQSGPLASRLMFASGQASQALALAARFNSPWSPLAWAGRGLIDLGQGEWLPAAGYLLLSLGLCSVVFLLALSSVERLYYSGWAGIQAGTRAKRPALVAHRASLSTPASPKRELALLPSPIRAILVKDFLVLRRDLRNMGQLVTPLIIGIVYAVMLVSNGGKIAPEVIPAPAWAVQATQNVWLYGNVGISLFVGWVLVSRLALMGISQEGQSYWLLKSSPLTPSRLLVAKFLVAYLPTLALGEGFLLVVSLVQRAGAGTVLFGALVVGLCLAGDSGLALALGVAGANLNWEDSRHMMSGTQGCLSTFSSFAYMLVALGLFFAPPVLLPLLGVSQTAGQVLGLLLGGAVAITCAVVPLVLVLPRVPLIGEA